MFGALVLSLGPGRERASCRCSSFGYSFQNVNEHAKVLAWWRGETEEVAPGEVVLVNLDLLPGHLPGWASVFIGFSGGSLLRGGTDVGE